jgi:hypothetical protein
LTSAAKLRGMAYTLQQLAELEIVIAGGVSDVEIDGRRVRYQDAEYLEKLRDRMKAELGVSTPKSARGRVWSPTISSGL